MGCREVVDPGFGSMMPTGSMIGRAYRFDCCDSLLFEQTKNMQLTIGFSDIQ